MSINMVSGYMDNKAGAKSVVAFGSIMRKINR